jgi:hypothetical protein
MPQVWSGIAGARQPCDRAVPASMTAARPVRYSPVAEAGTARLPATM